MQGIMTLEEFKDFVKTGKPLDTEEIHQFMDKMGGEARKITFRLNSAYHTPEEIRDILSELFGKAVPTPAAISRTMAAYASETDAR